MDTLEKLRTEIDKTDRELTELFEKRMRTILEIARYKKENGIEILNAGREEKVLENAVKNLKDEDLTEDVKDFFTGLMRISRDYQKRKIEE